MFRLYYVLYRLWNIYEGAIFSSVCFISNTQHSITCLALTQLFPVLLAHRFHIVKYTHYVTCYCNSLRILSFLFSYFVQMEQMNFISSNLLECVAQLSWKYDIVVWLISPHFCSFYPDSQTVDTHSDQRVY